MKSATWLTVANPPHANRTVSADSSHGPACAHLNGARERNAWAPASFLFRTWQRCQLGEVREANRNSTQERLSVRRFRSGESGCPNSAGMDPSRLSLFATLGCSRAQAIRRSRAGCAGSGIAREGVVKAGVVRRGRAVAGDAERSPEADGLNRRRHCQLALHRP